MLFLKTHRTNKVKEVRLYDLHGSIAGECFMILSRITCWEQIRSLTFGEFGSMGSALKWGQWWEHLQSSHVRLQEPVTLLTLIRLPLIH